MVKSSDDYHYALVCVDCISHKEITQHWATPKLAKKYHLHQLLLWNVKHHSSILVSIQCQAMTSFKKVWMHIRVWDNYHWILQWMLHLDFECEAFSIQHMVQCDRMSQPSKTTNFCKVIGKMEKEYLYWSSMTILCLLLFITTYLYEKDFSSLII